MPQLMPIYWVFFYFMVIYMIMVNFMMFFDLNEDVNFLKGESKGDLGWVW